MKNYLEPYAKENSLLQLSLFYFGKGRLIRTSVDWSDNESSYQLECICKYGIPGSFEQDVYTAAMRIWVSLGMPEDGIRLNYSDIARVLKLKPKNAVGRIKASLKKLAQARYEFTQCFFQVGEDGRPQKTNTHFSLFDSASLFDYKKGQSKKCSESHLYFPKEIKRNLEAKYYQLLDMAWYRALPEGLPRRLYEFLAKKRYHNVNGVFTISEAAICRWLPITDKHVANRRKRLAKIAQALIDEGYLQADGYMFDKKRKHCRFAYAPKDTRPKKDVPIIVDQPAESTTSKAPKSTTTKFTHSTLTKTPKPKQVPSAVIDQLELYDAVDWLNTIPYFQKKHKREIAGLPSFLEVYPGVRAEYDKRVAQDGNRPRPSWVYKEFMVAGGGVPAKKVKQTLPREQLELFENPSQPESKTETLEYLLNLLKIPKPTKKLRQVIENHSQEKSYEYVKWSILYANKQVKNEPANTFSRRYSIYLQKTLRENYAEEWKEEERNRIETAKERHAKEDRKREETRWREKAQKKVEKEKPAFLAAVANLQDEEKKKLWKKAKETIPGKQEHGRSLAEKIKYLDGLWAFLAEKGEKFSEAVKVDMGLARKMVRPE